MPTITETDLKELKDLITGGFSRIDAEISDLKINQVRMEERLSGQIHSLDERLSGQIKAVDEKLSGQINSLDERLSGQINSLDERLSGQIKAVDEKLSGQIKAVDERLSGKINVVDEKITGLGKRLDFQEFLNRGFLIGLGIATLTGLAKLLGFLPDA
jgi:primosomal protein N''